jgi:hypothetical protein
VSGLGQPHSNPTDGYWQTIFSEGFFEVPVGQNVQLNVNLRTASGSCQLANATAEGDTHTSIIAWPL